MSARKPKRFLVLAKTTSKKLRRENAKQKIRSATPTQEENAA